MKAAQYSRFGGPEVLEIVDLPDPEPAPGQIRVRVRAVGVNPIDWKVRQGMMGGDLPKRTGLEVAGTVDALGDGVTGVAVGDAVFGPSANGGGAAELALLAEWATIPESLDFTRAAALPVAVETATRTLDLLGVTDGQTVLINGAAGAVGIAAVQLARSRGARVIGTASPSNHDFLRSLGAEPTTYGEGMADRVARLAPDGVDRALDAAGGGVLPALVKLTGAPEHVVTIVDYPGAQETGVTFSGGPGSKRAWHALGEVSALADAGSFSLPVAATFPLEKIADAHRESETMHVRGKIVLTVG
ncbi:MAG: NADP-dependent oxidoreductase [Solirubrobacteraceae bacterium]